MELKEKTDSLLDHAGDYVDTYYKLAMLNITEKTAKISSTIIGALLVVLFLIFVILFAGLGLSWWIGGMLENMTAGYFIVAGVYMLIILLLVAMRKKTIDPWIRNFIVKKIYE